MISTPAYQSAPTTSAIATRSVRGSRLCRQAHTSRADQARIGRLETPEGPAGCPLEVYVLIVGAAESEVGRCVIAIWNRHETKNDAARIDFGYAADAEQLRPQIAADVVMDAIGSTVAGDIGACLHACEGKMERILGALGTAHRGPGHKSTVQDAAASRLADGQHRVVRRTGKAVGEEAAVHHPA